jgi:hypothetical protein
MILPTPSFTVSSLRTLTHYDEQKGIRMGFFAGRLTFVRFKVKGPSPRMFGEKHLERLEASAVGRQKHAASDGIEVGWIAGEHILDTRFDLAKNIVNDTLHFALRLDTQKVPADLLRAYTQIELEGLAASNPSGRPSARQKREARERARQQLEDEARDGRYLRRKAYSVLWDAPSNELLIGTSAVTVLDRLHTLFRQSFGHDLEPLSAGRQAYQLAEARNHTRAVDDARPAAFTGAPAVSAVAWQPDDAGRDFLGNEFLMWLWFQLDAGSDTLALSDGSEAAVMLNRTLVLECPRGETGRETITSDAPTQLPEARRAVQAGKLPRRAGLTVVRHDQQYELTLQAESLAVSGCRLPAPEAIDDRARLEERVTQLRALLETLDLLYDAFGRVRQSEGWPRELSRMQKWLVHERGRATG